MIDQTEVTMYLADEIPEIKNEMGADKKGNAFALMSSLALFADKNIETHDYRMVKRCFSAADKLYDKGNAMVRSAVQNVFVYSFTRMFQRYPAEKEKIMAIIPITLYSLYIAQVCHKGC